MHLMNFSRLSATVRGLRIILVCVACTAVAAAQTQIPKEYQSVLDSLGRKGDYRDNVLKVAIPRNDLSVTVAGIATPTPFGFGGWIAMTKGDHAKDVMMGDLVLLQDEVNPVMSALLENGLEVTALHNHFFWDEPHVYYMHVHGHGAPGELARKIKPALDLIGKDIPADQKQKNMDANKAVSAESLDTGKLTEIIGHNGEKAGSVFKYTIGRDDIKLREMGAVINARMGLNTWAAFIGSNEHAAVAGDVAMLESEVTPVLKALRANGLNIVALHHHMTGSRPMIIFLHYWGTGEAAKLATGFRAALDELGR
jgi:hypothetical protein